MIDAGIILEFDNNHYQLTSSLTDAIEPNFRRYKAIQFAKNLVINQFGVWSRNIGLNSFNTAQQNSEVGGFKFAFTSPTYIAGLVQYGKTGTLKPGFLVADLLIGNSVGLKEVDFFVQKINAIRSSNPTLRLFPILITEGMDVLALNTLKKNGVLIASIKEIFGESYSELLKNLINTVINAGAILKTEPERYLELIEKLTKLVDGKTNNLRGDLFELAVGYYYGKKCQSIDIGKRIRLDGEIKSREVDVLAIYEGEVRAVECKGYNYPIDKDFVQIYLNDKVPEIRKWLQRFYPNKQQTFEVWSTGGFTNDATALLEKAKVNTKKYKIDYLNKEKILERAQELQTSKFTDIIKSYYFKEIT